MDTMLTQLGQIFAPKPRQAENTDTHQYIRRHDQEQERRRKKKGQNTEDIFELEDSTAVSVSALRSFLESVLENLDHPTPEKPEKLTKEIESPEIRKDFASHKPVSDKMARGISAYQSASKTKDTKPMKTEEAMQTAETLGLHASDIRTIHALISDLKIIQNADQETLTIEHGDNFLSSLVSAVNKAKTLIN